MNRIAVTVVETATLRALGPARHSSQNCLPPLPVPGGDAILRTIKEGSGSALDVSVVQA